MLAGLLLQFGGFYLRALYPALKILAIIIGVGLIFNSIRGMLAQEGMYDEQSRTQMTISGWLGIVAGIGLVIWGLSLLINIG